MGEIHHLRQSGSAAQSLPTPIDLARVQPFMLGLIRVVPFSCELECAGSAEKIEPKAMLVLLTLAQQPGTIFSRDDLIDKCWDGRAIGDSSVARIISILRARFREVGEHTVQIETHPKVGYRLLLEGAPDRGATGRTELADTGKKNSRLAMGLLSAVLVAMLALAAAFWLRPSPVQDQLVVTMLPIVASDEIEPLVARGFETELRNELARSEALSVTLSNTAGQLAEQETSLAEIGATLDADYVWRGELRRTDGRVVYSAEVLDTREGKIVWSDFLASADDQAGLLPLRAARAMLNAIGRPVDAAIAELAITDEDYNLYLTALGLIETRDARQMAAAIDVLKSLIRRHPNFSGSFSAIAKAQFLTSTVQPEDIERATAIARENAERALELDPQSVEALKVMAMLVSDSTERFDYISRAVTIDPGNAEAWLWYSHISAHPDFAPEELRAMERLISIDPLWGRSWQASYVAAAEDGLDLAESIDRDIIAAASQPWQRQAAEGRIANLRGDISEFYRLTLLAMPSMEMDHRQVAGMQMANLMLLLGMESPQPRQTGAAGVVQEVLEGRLPPIEEFTANGLDGGNFWLATPLVIGAPGQFIREGREEELLSLYDSVFSSPADLEAYAENILRPHHFIPQTATYVGFAMRKVGREREATALFDLAEKSVARWRANSAMTMTPSLFEANLAAARGQRERAIDAVARLPRYGYPYVLQSPGVALTGPLLGDPIWEPLQDDPRLLQILAPIRSVLIREKREIEEIMVR